MDSWLGFEVTWHMTPLSHICANDNVMFCKSNLLFYNNVLVPISAEELLISPLNVMVDISAPPCNKLSYSSASLLIFFPVKDQEVTYLKRTHG